MTQHFVGHLASRDDRILAGWIFHGERVGAPCTVTLTVGDWRSQPVVADKPRRNLAGLGDGRSDHGFAFRVPQEALVPGARAALHVEGAADPVIAGVVPTEPGIVGRVGSLAKALKAAARGPSGGPKVRWTDALSDPFEALDVISAGGHPLRSEIRDLDDLSDFGAAILKRKRLFKLLRDAGRAQSRARRYEAALRLLQAARALEPGDGETTFHYAVSPSPGSSARWRDDVPLRRCRIPGRSARRGAGGVPRRTGVGVGAGAAAVGAWPSAPPQARLAPARPRRGA